MIVKQRKHKEILADFLFIIIGVGVIIFTVLTTKSIQSLEGDKCPQTYALFVNVARAMHNKELNLWLPYIWGGSPNIGNFITEAFYPVNGILCSLFYDAETTLVSYAIVPWNIIIHCCIYYAGFYFLVQKIGFSKLNAFATAISSTLCCSLLTYRVWLVFFDGFCYLPFIILFTIMLYETEEKLQYSFILAILFALEATISLSIMLVFSVYILGILFIAYGIKTKKEILLKNLKYSILTGILAMFLVAPLLFGTLVFMQNMVRYVPDLGFVEWGVSLPIEQYSKHSYHLADLQYLLKFTNFDIGISISAFSLLFGIVGLFSKEKANRRLKYISIFGMLICGLACFAIIFPAAFYYIPGVNQLREAYMYGILLNLFVSILAAWGFNAMEKFAEEKNFKNEIYIIPCGILVLCLLCYNVLSKDLTCILFVALSVIWGLVIMFRKTGIRKISFYICTFSFLILCGSDLYRTINVYMCSELEAIQKVGATCENSQELVTYIDRLDPIDTYYRMTTWGTLPVLPVNMSSVLGYYDVASYMNPLFSSGVNIHLQLSLEQRAKLQNLKYLLVNANDESYIDLLDNSPNFTKIGEKEHIYTDYSGNSEGTVYIYQVLANLGDAWLVSDYSWNETSTQKELLSLISNNTIDVSKTAIIDACTLSNEEKKCLDTINPLTEGVPVTCRNVTNNSLIYEIETEESAILVTTELYYPGWQVYINGERRTLLRVDGTNRGVIVPGGKSIVEFRFRPVGYQVGICLQCIAVFVIALGYVMNYGKKQVKFRHVEHQNNREISEV